MADHPCNWGGLYLPLIQSDALGQTAREGPGVPYALAGLSVASTFIVLERLSKFHFVAFFLFIHFLQNKYAAACWILLPCLCKVLWSMRIYCILLLLRWLFSEVFLCGFSVYCVFFLNVITLENGVVFWPGVNIYAVF